MVGVPPQFAEYVGISGPQRPGPRTALGRVVEDKADRPYRRRQNRSRLLEGESAFVAAVESRRFPDDTDCADAQGQRADRRDCHLSPGSAALHRKADRVAVEFRRPGGHRHRERATARRTTQRTDDLSNHFSSRPPPPTCSRSSAARRSICRQCCKPSLNQLPGSAMPTRPLLPARKKECSTAPKHTAFLANSWIMSEIFRSSPNAALGSGVRCSKGVRCISPT